MATCDPTLERSFRGHKDVITSLSFKPSMTQLASSSMDNSVMVWNFKPQLRAFRFVGHKGVVTSVDFSHTGNVLASSSRDNTVRLWTPTVKGDVTVFRAHTSSVRTVQFSNDSEKLLTASDDKTVKIWSSQRTKFLYTLSGHLNWVRTAKFSPDAKLVVSGSDDKTLKLWDLNSKTCIKTYFDHIGMISSVAFHPAGTIVASAGIDKSIKLFDIRTHKLIQHYSDAHLGANVDGSTTQGGVNSICFGGSQGEWMISSGMDGLVKIWDLKEGHLLYTLYGHKYGSTTAAVFSPKGDFFATGGSDSQVMVWKSNLDSISKVAESFRNEKNETFKEGNYMQKDINKGIEFSPPKQIPNLHQEPSVDYNRQNLNRSPIVQQASGGVTKSIYNESEKSNPLILNIGESETFLNHQIGSSNRSISSSPVNNGSYRSYSPSRLNTSSPISQFQPEYEDIPAITSNLEVQNENISSEDLVNTLKTLTNQINVLTQTMGIFETRLAMNEDHVQNMDSRFNTVLDRMERILNNKETPQINKENQSNNYNNNSSILKNNALNSNNLNNEKKITTSEKSKNLNQQQEVAEETDFFIS